MIWPVGLLLSALLAAAPAAPPTLDITLANGSPAEQQTKVQLERLLRAYDLSRWCFTRKVVVDQDAIPHSHPTLTLHTRHLLDDELLVSTFIHEQLHWYVSQHPTETEAAIRELRELFPSIPVGFPAGSSDERGNYAHMLIIPLEYRADRELLGELRARQVMEFWTTDHYTWLYRTVLERRREIGAILVRHGLVPDARAGS